MLSKNDLPIRVENQGQAMPLKFIDLNSPSVVTLNCDNQKNYGEREMTQRDLKQTKNDNIVQEENTDKVKIKFEINKDLVVTVSSYYDKNCKVIRYT